MLIIFEIQAKTYFWWQLANYNTEMGIKKISFLLLTSKQFMVAINIKELQISKTNPFNSSELSF